jgi:hypothetical protein
MPEDEIISASEIGQWTYCNRAWYLARTGAANRNVRDLARGERVHAHHGRRFALASVLVRAGVLLLLLAALLLVAGILLGG